MSSFTDLGVPARLTSVLTRLAIETPTPIQRATLPDALAGRDVLGRGRTGSGKTLAFLLPVVARLSGGPRAQAGAPRALILAPTRELAAQIDTALQPLAAVAGLTSCTVFGGVGQNPQVAAIRRGVDIVVACPGRLEDLIKQRHCSLAQVKITVLDEADHMADLGFLPAVRRLLGQTPSGGQRMLFSATLDKAIDTLVRQYLNKPAVHEADSAQSPVGTMAHHVLHVERDSRLPVLVDLSSAPGRTVVFTRTKHGAKALARHLNRAGVPTVELHGNLSQNARTRNLDDFQTGRAAALVATDIAARGIHVDDVALVIHADPPADHKAYLHRSGRTARAGNSGTVITLATTDQLREVSQLARTAGIKPATTRVASADHPILSTLAPGVRSLTSPTVTAEPETRTSPAQRRPAAGTRGTEPTPRAGRRRGRRPASGQRGGRATASAGRATASRPAAATARGSSADHEAGPSSSERPRSRPTHSAATFSARRGR
ncbi:DEAD/DEAH box helicase [Pseudofrankia inefficax]|uniref:DEAD/DEAH box helicase domain protein n=1 Tax=Pseudofrankia inefficax (strain DSM 45817 / CECT 9037 / DDB 130130 / EuI1c) TaxID=298654 RepID=E3J8Q2_PSEI1|nr:DEAD/DEAH box helicase [Pseudofrankia inefficax]ADP78495.1 DEAD/DEAH box helicase domain protein [Pseudofrankia inefficax]